MKIFLIFALCFASCSGGNGQNISSNKAKTNNKNESMPVVEQNLDIKNIIGEDKIKAISKAKKVIIYQIDEFITDANSRKREKKYFSEYEVLNFKELDKEKAKEIKKLFLNGRSYTKNEFNERCPFTADLGIEFVSKKRDSNNVIISFQCKKLLFIDGNKETYKDLSSIEPFYKIFQENFKSLENQTKIQ